MGCGESSTLFFTYVQYPAPVHQQQQQQQQCETRNKGEINKKKTLKIFGLYKKVRGGNIKITMKIKYILQANPYTRRPMHHKETILDYWFDGKGFNFMPIFF